MDTTRITAAHACRTPRLPQVPAALTRHRLPNGPTASWPQSELDATARALRRASAIPYLTPAPRD